MSSLIMLGWMRENRKEGKWVGEVGVGHGYWTILCNFSLSYNPPHFGKKYLGGKWGMWPTHFSSPIFFPLPFSPHPSKGKYFPHPIFLSHFLSSPIFPPSKHTRTVFVDSGYAWPVFVISSYACFVTSCHACFVVLPRLVTYPRGLCVHACFRSLELRLFFVALGLRLTCRFRAALVIRLCQFLYRKQVFS